MRWPYDKRADPVHAWGAVAAGIAIDIGIAGVLATLNANNHDFRWWWPTNWMIVGVVVVAIGLALLIVPVRRSQPPPPVQPDKPVFTGALEGTADANKRTADAVKKHMEEGLPPTSPGPGAPHG